VPLFAISLSVMAAFPVFGRVRARFATEVLDVLVPSSSADVADRDWDDSLRAAL